ncbi:unnamed protein product [Protopolystoma xenopodis]|uniref:Uncharacterized protein n=1 Tax=Protopolystoma xenopodis TaxID=117903 RepID=A0A3S5CH50_9PLAT|nr:unnamed protein product [Protopolystoma xenopodis]
MLSLALSSRLYQGETSTAAGGRLLGPALGCRKKKVTLLPGNSIALVRELGKRIRPRNHPRPAAGTMLLLATPNASSQISLEREREREAVALPAFEHITAQIPVRLPISSPGSRQQANSDRAPRKEAQRLAIFSPLASVISVSCFGVGHFEKTIQKAGYRQETLFILA